MNANRKIRIDIMINHKHDHYIEPKKGLSIKKRPCKKRGKR